MLANHNAIEDGGYVIERSLRFSSASSQYLTRTATTPTSGTTWTWSGWVKRGALTSAEYGIFGGGTNGTTTYDALYYTSSTNTLQFFTAGGSSLWLVTSQVFRDPSAYYHILAVYDSTQATASNRAKLYINGVPVTSFSTANYPAQNTTSLGINANSVIQTLGAVRTNAIVLPFDGYMSEVHFIDGQALTPSSFGEINPTTGQWVAKKYTGTYGTNGFYLDFKDGTSTTTLGQDKSGNGNNWALTNFTRSAGVNDCWVLDVPAGNGSASAVPPSGNYAVLNPLDTGGTAPLNGNLTLTAGAVERGVRSTFAVPTTGLYYAEAVVGTNQTGARDIAFGFVASTTNLSANPFNISNGWLIYGTASTSITRNGTNTLAGAGAALVAGDILQIAIDLANNKGWVGKNNIWFNGSTGTDGNPSTGTNPTFTFSGPPELFVLSHVYSSTINVNFGQRSFAYTPPAGFKALCTANLPTPSIKKPSDHFNVQLSTGANIKTDSEALFSNELEWIKDRANANNHQLIDSVRGSNAVLQANTTAAETTYTAPSGSSIGWVWRASDSAAVTNSSGSISSQVSANVTAGFSVVTYTGNGVNATVGHGLGIAPKMVIVKRRDTTANWQVHHSSIAVANSIQLNLANASASATTVWNSTSPTSSVFSIGTSTDVNASAGTYVAYCFAEIAGYSKFGRYTGNGSADGPFVHTGFTPKFLLIKNTSTTGPSWMLLDTVRNTFNITNLAIQPNAADAETSAGFTGLDVVSNGFKVRDTSTLFNANGSNYIYAAFAECPINYANAR